MTATLLRTPVRHGPAARAHRVIVRQWDRTPMGAARLSPLGYHLTVSHAHRFLWFRVAKVGTRTILGHLDQHATLDVRHGTDLRYPREALSGYLAFAFVRHPVDRFVSAWRDKVVDTNHFGFDDATLQRMQRIEEFVAWVGDQDLDDIATDRHLNLQVRLVDTTRVDRLGRLESFADDFAGICRAIGLPATPPETRNRSQGRGFAAPDLAPPTRRRIEDLYRRDLEVFGYE